MLHFGNQLLKLLRPIFIVGCPRSGTTLLRDLLRSHPNLTFPRESHFIPRFFRAYGDPTNEREAVQLATRVLRLDWIRQWDFEAAPQQFAGCRSFREFVNELYTAYASTHGKKRWGDKTPPYLTEMPTLLQLFPEAQIIHIYRDGRDVAMSWVRSGYEPENIYAAASMWKSRVEQARSFGATLPVQAYREVSYEALLRDTPKVMRDLCAFLEEPYCDDVLKISKPAGGEWRARPGRDTAGVRANNREKWRSEMPARDRILFESVAGGLLGELGYELEGRIRRVGAAERLLWQSHQTCMKAVRRLWWSLEPARAFTGVENQLAAFRARARQRSD